jgi:hypothetical protein
VDKKVLLRPRAQSPRRRRSRTSSLMRSWGGHTPYAGPNRRCRRCRRGSARPCRHRRGRLHHSYAPVLPAGVVGPFRQPSPRGRAGGCLMKRHRRNVSPRRRLDRLADRRSEGPPALRPSGTPSTTHRDVTPTEGLRPHHRVQFCSSRVRPCRLTCCGNGGSVNGEGWDHNKDRIGSSRSAEAFARRWGERSTFTDDPARTRPVPATARRTRNVSHR